MTRYLHFYSTPLFSDKTIFTHLTGMNSFSLVYVSPTDSPHQHLVICSITGGHLLLSALYKVSTKIIAMLQWKFLWRVWLQMSKFLRGSVSLWRSYWHSGRTSSFCPFPGTLRGAEHVWPSCLLNARSTLSHSGNQTIQIHSPAQITPRFITKSFMTKS